MGYMSDKFIIQGQAKLEGVINISGAKNSAGPILAATLLTKESCIVDNLPLVKDILNSIEILKSMGAEVEWLGEKKIRITAANVSPEKIAISLIGKSRVSVLLIGALLARFNEFKFTPPGGDRIGLRPITTHLDALGKLGAKVTRENSDYCFDGSNLKGEKIILKEFENELLKYESNEIEFIKLILSNSQNIDSYNINFISEDNNKIEIENILNKIIKSEWGKSFLPKNIKNLKINEKFEILKNFINNLKID